MFANDVIQELNAVVFGLRKRGQDLTPVMYFITAIMEQAVARNFNERGRYNAADYPVTVWSGGASRWKDHAQSTSDNYAFNGKFPNRQLLVRTGNLRRQIEITPFGKTKVRTSVNIPYARIHQEGGMIPAVSIKVTKKMKKYFWARFYESDNAEKSKWKSMALAKNIERPAFYMDARPYIVFSEDDLKEILAVIKSFIFPN